MAEIKDFREGEQQLYDENVQLKEPESRAKPWETGEWTGVPVIDWGIQKAVNWALGKYQNVRKKILYGSPVSRVYNAYVLNAVRRIVHGAEFGVEVNEVDADYLNSRKVMGRWEERNGRKTAYIPRIDAVPGILGRTLDDYLKAGVQAYIKVHEIMEAYLKPTDQEHDEFDAMVLDSLEKLSYFDPSARQAYEGALYVYKRRNEVKDPVFDRVAEYKPDLARLKAAA